MIDDEVDDTVDVDSEVDNGVDFVKVADVDMDVVVDDEKVVVLIVDKVFVSEIVEEGALDININHPRKCF